MVSYEPLWRTLEEKGISTYTLIHTYGINPRTINNLRHNRGLTLYSLEKLCVILDVGPEKIIEFIKEE